MSTLTMTARILRHEGFRDVACCLCQAAWYEQFVGITLTAWGSPVGPLCPRCLSQRPGDTAKGMRSRGAADPQGLATAVEAMAAWGETVADVIAAERQELALRLNLTSNDLRRLVDDRYQEFLAGAV